jgi:hypothetical protein
MRAIAMLQKMNWGVTGLVAGLVLVTGLTGCTVRIEKDASGKDKNVQVETPFGGVHVNTDQTTASDLGLPAYPGAVLVKDKDNNAADVHLGFGQWQLRVRAVSYSTSDSKEKVAAFYKKAMGRYGDVITCQGNSPVGTPTMTADGLTCAEDKSSKVKIDRKDYGTSKDGLALKAGSKRHQHIVGFDDPKDGKIRFALIALDLPAETGNSKEKSD